MAERSKEKKVGLASAEADLRDPQSSFLHAKKSPVCFRLFSNVSIVSLPFSFVTEDEVLLCVKDISHFLMQDIAFLSGKQTFSYIKIRYMFESINKVNLVLLIGGYIIFIFQ